MINLGEVITAMITPFYENGDVDYLKARKLSKKLSKEGSDSILVSGTTGESPALSNDEKLKLLEAIVEESNGLFPVMAGTGTNNTDSSVKQSIDAVKAGADALLLVVPYYNKPPQEGMYRHFASIAEKCDVPLVLYNIPGRTGVNMANTTIERLRRDFPHIAAVKDAAGNIEQTSDLMRLMTLEGHIERGFKIYSGDDSLTLPMLSCGASGVISVASHIVGKQIKDMITKFFKGKIAEALKIHLELLPVFKGLFETTNPILVKEAVSLLWEDMGGVRLPLVPADENQKKRIKEIVSELN